MRIIALLILVVFASNGHSQNAQKDSLFQLIKASTDQSEKAILYGHLAKSYEDSNVDSSVYYAKKGYELSKSNNYKIGIAENAAHLGYYYILKNDLDSAKINYSRAKQYYSKTDSLLKYTRNSMRLGNVNLAQNKPIEAIKLYLECLEISKKNNFVSLIPHLYNNTGLVYKQIEDYDDAEANFQSAYSLFLENNDEANSVYSLYNISLIKSIVGDDEEAIDGYLNLISYHLKTENWVSLAQIYNSISEIYLKNENYDQSQEYLEMALSSIKDKSDSFNTGPTSFHQASIYTNAAELNYIQNRMSSAKVYARLAFKLSEENSYTQNILQSAKILANIMTNPIN